MEILTRVNLSNFHIKTFKVLILIAFIRMIIVISIISIIEYYQLFLKKEEHNKRYQELILLNAYFKSEIYFMNKNMIQIEKVMKKSYDAQKTAIKYGYNDLQVTLLDISKDIHEIKKDYSMAISGLETIKSKDYQITDIYLNDIFKILKCHLMDHDKWYDFYIHFNSDKNILLKKHFFFTSILRNLINNAIEAINKNVAHIYIETKIQNNMFTCIVTDNGSGIKEKNLPYIFNSGFSNKYDSISGFSQRGLGLTFVKDLVEKEYKGTITVKSIINKETSFIINIPINNIRKD
jgi:two-component system sensor histidine kinase YcbA